ncbi:hypothetical protein VJ923_07260 [Adlercreutzia sp. R25]|uniref:hypothetical protein n=1 Tax=Adlercreutzia shanghongiae TaxID=3111773 RepID=UPI002DBF1CC3|nr:hypothetical protein [Adlercreutzia sp. R25]MEC4272952.1 hypothetical protein [Adlercreutzia sp. R25]
MARLNNYLQSLARSPRICPKCRSRRLRLEETLNPNVGKWRCDCGYFMAQTCPEAANVPVDDDPPERGGARIIRPDFGGNGR